MKVVDTSATGLAVPWRTLATVAIATVASGCAQIHPDFGHQREEVEQVSRIDRHSSFPAIRRLYFEQVNLIEMIDPSGEAERAYPTAWGIARGSQSEESERSWGVRYDLVLSWFRDKSPMDPVAKVRLRNGVQDKMLAVTTSRCNVFKTFLRRQQSDVNFYLGTATTAAGVLGAVLPGVRASRNLAGTAGLLSGAQAEFNGAYYSNLAAQVIVQGVDLRMAKLRKELLESRQGKGIDEYSLEAAINDALVIDGACSTVTGLTEAADSIKEVATPGLNRAASVIAAVKAAGEIAQADKVSELAESGRLQKLLKQASPDLSPLVVTNLARPAPTSSALLGTLAQASRAQATIDAHVEGNSAALTAAFITAQAKLAESNRAAADVGKKLAENFRKKVDDVVPKDALKRCVAALEGPAKDFGSADAAAQLEAGDDVARANAAATLATARVSAQAAVDRVLLIIDFAITAADATAKAWKARFSDVKLELTALDKVGAPTAPAALSNLCKPAS